MWIGDKVYNIYLFNKTPTALSRMNIILIGYDSKKSFSKQTKSIQDKVRRETSCLRPQPHVFYIAKQPFSNLMTSCMKEARYADFSFSDEGFKDFWAYLDELNT